MNEESQVFMYMSVCLGSMGGLKAKRDLSEQPKVV